MEIVVYQSAYKKEWDDFVEHSKNGTFLLKRDYMEYHSDRFTDSSFMFFEGGKLLALLPASLHGDRLVSHGGLTYGGFVTDLSMTTQKMLDIMESLLHFLKEKGFTELVYKRVPAIFHSYPSDEDLYALFRVGAILSRCGISSTIFLPEKIKYAERRRRAIKKATRAGLRFVESKDFVSYVDLLSEVLAQKHGAKPVHTSEELTRLASRFPANIRLFLAYKEDKLLAGTIIYETPLVAHTQYLANSEEGRSCGALDFVIDKLITEEYSTKRFFDLGTSNEEGGLVLNEGLIEQKQEFGGRGILYEEFLIRL